MEGFYDTEGAEGLEGLEGNKNHIQNHAVSKRRCIVLRRPPRRHGREDPAIGRRLGQKVHGQRGYGSQDDLDRP